MSSGPPNPRKSLPLSALDPELGKFDHQFFGGFNQVNGKALANKLPSHKPPKKMPRRTMPYELRKIFRAK